MPGLDGTGNMFKPLLSSLGPKINTHIISYPSDRYLSFDELSGYVRNQLKDIDDQIVLLAESFSGPIAINLLQNPLPSIKAVIFSATFCERPRSLLISFARILPLEQIFKIPIPTSVIKLFCLGFNVSSETVDLFRNTIANSNIRILSKRVRDISRLKLSKLSFGNIPCCYIQAQYDRLVPSSCFNSFQRFLPQIQLFKIKGSHFILQAKPHECKEIIVRFINKNL